MLGRFYHDTTRPTPQPHFSRLGSEAFIRHCLLPYAEEWSYQVRNRMMQTFDGVKPTLSNDPKDQPASQLPKSSAPVKAKPRSTNRGNRDTGRSEL